MEHGWAIKIDSVFVSAEYFMERIVNDTINYRYLAQVTRKYFRFHVFQC